MPDNKGSAAAVYVSWKTFQNSLDQLAKGELPNVIDKTVFTGMAFSIQNQLFTGMRFLRLIDDRNKPTLLLEKLTTADDDGRKRLLREVLQERYADLFALNLKKTTPDELEKKMGDVYGVSGDTKDKAIRFFVSAAKDLGIEMSPLFSTGNGGGANPSRVGKKRSVRRQSILTLPNTQNGSPGGGTSKTVQLQSGGTLTLSATLDLFSLNAEDRKFVFELIDRLDGYQQPAVESAK